jgi:hypothetical protein
VPAALLQFARDIASKISADTISQIRTQWASTGRMAVSCGAARRKGLSGILTLNPAGRPVVWAPKSSSARGKLRALVAAGGGGDEVPAGYEEVEPKVFEERAGYCKTRNWQLSIVLTGRLLQHMAMHRPGCCLQDAWAQEAFKQRLVLRCLLRMRGWQMSAVLTVQQSG